MQHQSKQSSRLGKHTRLAVALALALGVGTSSAMAAQASAANRIQAADANVTQLTRGVPSGEAGGIAATAQPAPRAASNRTMATISVTNCNDSGSGSLREAVSIAPSGAIVDMSGLSCTINLSSSIVTSADDLTLRADTTPSEIYSGPTPTVTLDGGGTIQPLRHTGTGTLSLHGLSVMNGYEAGLARGGCISSLGSVNLTDSSVKYCTAKDNDGSSASGGGIYASDSVSLDHSAVAHNKAVNTGGGVANGGGIFAGYGITMTSYSTVKYNTAEGAGTGAAYGGGLYAVGGLNITDSIIDSNSVETANGATAYGGGAFTRGYSILENSTVTGNHADGDGGGLFLADGGQIKYSTINDNDADTIGGGVFSEYGGQGLSIETSTFDGNHAGLHAGALFARGNVSIDDSTISNNTSLRVAGADLGRGATQPISITQSTISGNVSSNSKWGAGLYLAGGAVIKNSTISGNTENTPANQAYGAGIRLDDNISLTMSSTIVSGNTLVDGSGNTIQASDIGAQSGSTSTVVTGDHNLIGYYTNVLLPGDTIFSQNPMLGPLQDNGGLTMTMAVLRDSPAFNKGVANGFTTDQRGTGYDRDAGGYYNILDYTDIGAYERAGDRIFTNDFECHRFDGCPIVFPL